MVDIENGKISRIDPKVCEAYTVEERKVFEEVDLGKLVEPNLYIDSTMFTVNRSLIDVNNHLHNIYFMDIANEVLPMEIYRNADFKWIQMMCKKEIKLGDTVKVFYQVENGEHVVVIKSEDEKCLHGIIRLK